MEQLLKNIESEFGLVRDGLKTELSALRTNRPTPQLVENINVSYAESVMKVKQLGSISVQPPRDIVVTLWDKGAAGAVAKAIEEANIGMNPAVQGNAVRMSLPPLTEERREDLMKIAKGIAEKAKIKVRSLRDGANKKVEAAFKEKTISEDQKFKVKKQVQDIVDRGNAEIESLLGKKAGEIGE
ncbi:MAG: ribosome recycling factor [Patescibacteria group bacterium]